jgi:cell wall-associated NlpC family hydrolase
MKTFDRRLTPARPDLAARHLDGMVEALAFTDAMPMRVAAPSAPLRREPRPDAPLDTEALHGELVRVYERHEGWAWGQLAGDDYVGYLPEECLAGDALPPTHRVSALRSFVYPGPSIKLPPLEALSFGATLAVTGESGEFYTTEHGGHLFKAHLAPRDRPEPDFVTVAERFLNVPYLWGGKTSLGLDCSALVQLSLASAGIAAPRDSDLQEKGLGEAVAFDERLAGLQRGDLVFWKGHVGIMLDARMMLHATAFTMTVMSEPLLGARDRILARNGGPITAIRRLG